MHTIRDQNSDAFLSPEDGKAGTTMNDAFTIGLLHRGLPKRLPGGCQIINTTGDVFDKV